MQSIPYGSNATITALLLQPPQLQAKTALQLPPYTQKAETVNTPALKLAPCLKACAEMDSIFLKSIPYWLHHAS